MPGAGRGTGRGKGNKAGGAPRIAGKRHKWTKEEYIVLFLLHTQYGLASGKKNVRDEKEKQIRRDTVDKIFCHIYKEFDSTYKDSRAKLLWTTFNDRWQAYKPAVWQTIDRPNPLDESKYTKKELEEFVAARHKIEEAAKSLDSTLR